ncbi:MAG TPA: aldo/keto reductase [Candidatus Binataceae bacterium]|jgi:aryl-alcohol dehydrogenase (NADP+)|nr:aldo/keto reductase [Candidatus Binataceae bacterium]
MEYVGLGNTGLKVSRICLGCMSYGDKRWREWVITGEEAREHFAAALEAGVNFFDTADVYSTGVSEEITGRWLGEMASRDEVVLATKVNGAMGPGPNRRGLSRKHILEACDASLRRLKTDFIDLYQIHRWDFKTPIEETLEALDSLVHAGKVRYLGASSMAAWQFSKALYTARTRGWHRFVSMQNHYNLVYREEEREMIPLCIDQGVGVIPWSPLARGFLAGNRQAGGSGETLRAKTDEIARGMYFRDSDFAVADAAAAIARERSVTPAQIACAWILQAPGVTAPIIGATKLNHVKELIAAAEITLNKEEVAALEQPYQPHPVLGFEPPKADRMSRGR